MAGRKNIIKIDNPQSLSRFGFSQDYLRYTPKEHHLWKNTLDDICKKAANLVVKNFMYTPTEGEFVEEKVSLNEAIHQLVMGRHQSLLVTKGKDIVGILRLTDVFREISNKISSCSGRLVKNIIECLISFKIYKLIKFY